LFVYIVLEIRDFEVLINPGGLINTNIHPKKRKRVKN
jgi:hypothetical protein